ncbi:flagellar hook-length control protein FliK [Burkholderia stagnalis]|uniref:flagellar hook-length control protein FliK n=1 Tax=Burkholderia stagnalis TaxID=1503054 RepID=UPI001E36B48C|nr:flagellar hook-length control protein FliK [Burkholderia stagnalis]
MLTGHATMPGHRFRSTFRSRVRGATHPISMTEPVATPRSRSNRPSSAKPRRRAAAAAAGRAPARAALQPGRDAQAADTHRDERTLDLFGDPVLDAGERVQMAARQAVAADTEVVVDDAHAHQQAMLDGFDAPQTLAADVHVAMGGGDAVAVVGSAVAEADGRAAASGEVASGGAIAEGASHGAGIGAAADVESQAASDGLAKDVPIGVNGHSTADIETEATSDISMKDAPTGVDDTTAAITSSTQDREPPNDAEEIAAAGLATKAAAPRAAGARSSAGTKRRASTATAREAAAPSAPAADGAALAPSQPDTPEEASPAILAASAVAATPSPSRPAASVASIVTKPSSDRVEPSLAAQSDDASAATPAFDPDAHLRPLSERLAALQAETTALHRAADREMRRVNRLLLALAVVVLAGLAALVLQTIQVSRLKQEAAAQQQRIDRLKADLTTQQASVMTLEQHNDMLMTQVNRLERSVSRQAPAQKPVAVKHGRRGIK